MKVSFDFLRNVILACVLALLSVNAHAQGFIVPDGTVISGHISSVPAPGKTPPVLTACGTTPAIVGDDKAGVVTMGTTATGCVITFATAWAGVPLCVVTWQATPLASQSYTVTATAITTVQTSTTNNLLNYWCTGRIGG